VLHLRHLPAERGERHAAERDLAAERRAERRGVGGVGHGLGRVEHLEQPVPRGRGALHEVGDPHEVVDRTVEVAAVAAVGEKPA